MLIFKAYLFILWGTRIICLCVYMQIVCLCVDMIINTLMANSFSILFTFDVKNLGEGVHI